MRRGLRNAASTIALAAVCGALAAASPCALVSNIDRAERLIRAGLLRGAIELLEATAAKSPACDPDQYRMLASTYLSLHEPARAVDAVERGLRAFPRFTLLQAYAVTVFDAAVAPAARRAALERALAITPASGALLKALGRTELRTDREGAHAGVVLARAVTALPADVEARCYYAEWLLAVGRGSDAARELDAAYTLSKSASVDRVSVLRLRAAAAAEANDDAGARRAFAEALVIERALADHPIYAQWDYVQYLIGQDRAGEAQPLLVEIIASSPGFGPAYFAQAKLHARAGDNEKARQAALLALERAPGVPEQKPIHAFLSRICHLMNDEREASEHEQWISAH